MVLDVVSVVRVVACTGEVRHTPEGTPPVDVNVVVFVAAAADAAVGTFRSSTRESSFFA